MKVDLAPLHAPGWTEEGSGWSEEGSGWSEEGSVMVWITYGHFEISFRYPEGQNAPKNLVSHGLLVPARGHGAEAGQALVAFHTLFDGCACAFLSPNNVFLAFFTRLDSRNEGLQEFRCQMDTWSPPGDMGPKLAKLW